VVAMNERLECGFVSVPYLPREVFIRDPLPVQSLPSPPVIGSCAKRKHAIHK